MSSDNVNELEQFISAIENFELLSTPEQIDYISYFLNKSTTTGIKPKDIDECFRILKLKPYSNTRTYLTRNLPIKGKPNQASKFLKLKDSYQLSRQFNKTIEESLGLLKPIVKANIDLRILLATVKNKDENDFLEEAIKCMEIGASRAAIIMTWNLAVDHIQELILRYYKAAFDSILLANIDKRIKIKSISSKDDFGEIPEGKFIEFLRSAGVISNDVRKILDSKLGLRNTAAHPSNVKITEATAIACIEELVNNIILKYPL